MTTRKNMKTICYGHKGNKNAKLKTPTNFLKKSTNFCLKKKITLVQE